VAGRCCRGTGTGHRYMYLRALSVSREVPGAPVKPLLPSEWVHRAILLARGKCYCSDLLRCFLALATPGCLLHSFLVGSLDLRSSRIRRLAHSHSRSPTLIFCFLVVPGPSNLASFSFFLLLPPCRVLFLLLWLVTPARQSASTPNFPPRPEYSDDLRKPRSEPLVHI
jgi:hypothetical protein